MNRVRVVHGMTNDDDVRRIVINKRHGGFNLSTEAEDRMEELGVEDAQSVDRDDDTLLKVIDGLGVEASSGCYCELKVVEIPSDVDWVIEEYDGKEWVSEQHRTWD